MQVKVNYSVEFTVVLNVPDDSSLEDEVANISIPEGDGGKYVEDSFEFISSEPFIISQ